mgnify:CR=1 FL=1
MKLNLSVLKSVLLSIDEEDYEKEWINNNIAGAIVNTKHPKGFKNKKHTEKTKNKIAVKKKKRS